MRYGRYGKMVTKPGKRDAVVAILRRNLEALRAAGCLLYVINHDAEDENAIWVTEVWESAESHAASLQLPAVREAIGEAMPLLTGEFEQVELSVVGGLGFPT